MRPSVAPGLSARLFAVALLMAACGSEPASVPIADPLVLAKVTDTNADPNVLEFQLEARETDVKFGAFPMSKAFTYNGSVPGPLVDAKVGDRLIIHFTNRLPEPTTVHWHGMRLPATMDGSLAMQKPVEPGGTFRYEYVLKDAGLFWFHPHMRTDVQIEKGLVGVIRVRGDQEPQVDDERILVLDDIRLKDDGTFPTYLDDTSKMLGREGNTILVNGRTDTAIPLRAGALTRWRILNAANGRFFNLKLPGVTWRVIGTDGGPIEKPYDTETLLIAPAERYDVVFVAPPEGARTLTSEPYERGHETGMRPQLVVANVKVIAGSPTRHALPSSFRPLERLADGKVTIPLVLDEGSTPEGDLIFTVNGATFPNVPMVRTPLGSTQIIEVKNESEMDHPFHLHGFFFQTLATNDVLTPPERTFNKDTIIVPAKARMRLAARFDEPGMWMYHCHINEHSEGGMMGEIHVE
jgi:FtsP/CotA-like multicopper oxidase with cupredoxin domain